ncbi:MULTISPECIES: DNA topoisomerase IB [unclassified Mycobacterium]|uniref:DNA topoisomerase IB n=1 Tax=unclassified Mycobacterium TaxID=2642494 RepID=UPI000800985F|nr:MULTISPECIES: DNA topoisomerase IB [unclassified Mycobacterium]OBG67202.1 DNA topoisomerase [Mycobacterium sp. E735]OBG68782.1 DNA topoisomerase [Mycobacterium sp. E3305]OBG85074.1 DNA topoisomerase [Mycobacterium sp. E3298]OBH19655.1 DNA topoisomerase [Mycobacterium sp. E1715]
MRLRRSVLNKPGIARKRRGKGFAYYGPDGELLSDPETLQRIKDLVIPPAWKNVWISPHPNGHIQAVGVDAAGRRQYLYHTAWQQERAEEKFDRVLELSTRLPHWRAAIAKDLTRSGLTRKRVLAVALRLLDRGYFRAGSEQYAEENESYGLATLLCEHVQVRRDAVAFDFPAKSGVRRTVEIEDPEVVRAVRALMRRPERTERLLVCRNATGWLDVRSDDLNARFKELVGNEFTVKDLRTWHGTVLAATAFADADPAVSQRVAKRVESAVMKEVAEELGNTPAVARGSYVDPRVVAGYEQGLTIAAATRRAERARDPDAAQEILDKATRMLIRRVAKGAGTSVLLKSA